MSTRFNKLPPKPEYVLAAKAAIERGAELSIQEISPRGRLFRWDFPLRRRELLPLPSSVPNLP